jgi:hypothetical protein
MADAEQQPVRFVEPAPFPFGYAPVFVSQDYLGVGTELLRASIGQGPRIEEADPPLAGDQEAQEGSWDVRMRVVRNRRIETGRSGRLARAGAAASAASGDGGS